MLSVTIIYPNFSFVLQALPVRDNHIVKNICG